MASTDPFTQQQDIYQEEFTELFPEAKNFETLDLSMSDADLDKMLITSMEESRSYWNRRPWDLENTDLVNTAFALGDQIDPKEYLKTDLQYKDNRIFQSVRAILSYATGQLAKPDITPSRGDEVFIKGARDLSQALYQHTADEKGEHKIRAAVFNLITRKRGFLKIRWDESLGLNGDIITEVVNPEDIIIDRFAGYLKNPAKIYHRVQCTIEELCAKYPDKKTEIMEAFSIRRGVFTQMSKMVYYYECWFTYTDDKDMPAEGVCSFIAEKHLILEKMKNPNYIYYKSRKKEKEANVLSLPPKPFIGFNYINTGHSYIDETCLVEQAIPLQMMLNKRLRQIGENADYVNGRWVYSKKAFSQEDARNLINKGARTLAGVDRDDVANALVNVAPNQLGAWVENTVYDYRSEIDSIMGTPSIFKGEQPDKKDTLGRDIMVKQQAASLQDDLVRSIALSMEEYYKLKLQLMRVYYTDDYWFQCKGADGKYQFILLNGDLIDSNVKVSVQVDSTLPLDKSMIRSTAMELWNAGNAIDIRTLYEDLGLPDPDQRAERYLKQNTDPLNYLQSIELSQIDTDAESDIMLLIADKTPDERDDYSQAYFDYFMKFMSSNRFQKLMGEDKEAAQRIILFLSAIQHTMMEALSVSASLNDAGMIPTVPPAGQAVPGATGATPTGAPPVVQAAGAGVQAPSPPGAAPPVPTQ